MNFRTLSTALMITTITFLSCNGQKKGSDIKLTNAIDSGSYGIGVSIGQNLGRDGLENVNLDIMMKAMRAAIKIGRAHV